MTPTPEEPVIQHGSPVFITDAEGREFAAVAASGVEWANRRGQDHGVEMYDDDGRYTRTRFWTPTPPSPPVPPQGGESSE